MRAEHLLRRSVIPAEHADFGLLFAPGCRFAHLPLHTKEIEPRKASTEAHLPLRQLAWERAEDGEALLQVQDGGWRGAPGRAAAVQVPALSGAARDYARARRGIVQTQRRFQGLGDRVRILGHVELIILRNQCRESKIVVPEIESIIVGVARIQIVVIEKIHGHLWLLACRQKMKQPV